ncbi:UDP-glucosyltransferase 2-like [Maniola jurtina]|uniref:UDP-glucosyltransferase 2-like n=1 Tax=Maniola jurtina TaxID=191418 RepID=UPI001E688926|nr:UDP-glucosyltransferase 2-like [Maniola jurtina]XP_045779382.1 UDP-glucosyltransferase 2-like [Maniola jurtina]XP_045779383.1 UDP-glucosyltransferase 2-like [Maniola jurtina]XP_045779384.1 UDP-glucosyltransferase 2-like [Maniola jurtina]
MLKKMQCLMLILATLCEVNAYRYLLVSPIPGKSHAILGEALVENLVNAGHEVTYITSFIPDKLHSRVTIVDVSENIKRLPEEESFNITAIMDGKNKISSIAFLASLMMNISKDTIENPNVQKLITDRTQTFDAVISEWMFNEVYAGFAGIFNCPFIWFSSIEPHWVLLELVDEMPNPAYTATVSSNRIPPLTFEERVTELYSQIVGRLMKTFLVSGLEHEIYNDIFVPVIRNRHNFVPDFETLRYNASLLLSNSHLSMGIAAKLPPNVICIGGYHIKPNVKPLPEDLQQLMDNAKHGVIYFSMGSTLRSTNFPDDVKKELLEMFGKFKQTVIWKFEEQLPNSPSNVHIVQWAPQQSILAHENCILFITHGGLLSTTETVHYGVPTIGIPVFGDQFVNVARAVKKGFALKVDLSHTMASDLEIAIGKILDNPKYTTRIKELSQIYHDRPVPPAKELVHWVEHVVKTRGAVHLRSPALMVPWYQKLYIDLILVILVIVIILKYVFRYLYSILFTKRKEKVN